ncbi:MAG TPA: twin-arginine translocation signal domain-containing protein, partial [Chroococcidiopsis sp.]
MDTRHSYSSLWRSPASTRRRFLQLSAAALSGLALANCRRNLSDVGASPTESSGGTSDTLHVYSWSGYFDDELLTSFTESTGYKVVADIYDSNETMLAKLQAGGGGAYSIIYPSDYMVQQMIELGLLEPLDKASIKGLGDLL